MANDYVIEYTDTFNGEANYSWLRRKTITMPELTHYGYDGTNCYCKANARMMRSLIRKAKKEMGLNGVRCDKDNHAGVIELRPRGSATVMFIIPQD